MDSSLWGRLVLGLLIDEGELHFSTVTSTYIHFGTAQQTTVFILCGETAIFQYLKGVFNGRLSPVPNVLFCMNI